MSFSRHFNDYDISVFPIEGQGRLLHNTFNFGANCPLHLSIPAYHLPVYASRCLLPHIAQDSVLDCWLSFVKAAIADRSLPCASRRNPRQTVHSVFPNTAFRSSSSGGFRHLAPWSSGWNLVKMQIFVKVLIWILSIASAFLRLLPSQVNAYSFFQKPFDSGQAPATVPIVKVTSPSPGCLIQFLDDHFFR